MANDSILTPGGEYQSPEPIQEGPQYLEKDKFLSEYENDGEKAVVRENLDVYSKGSVYNKTESDTLLSEAIKAAFEKYLGEDDPHGIIPKVTEMIRDFIKKDGSTPFTKPQVGADPQIDSHLSTKRYVDKAIYKHIVDVDPHGFISILNNRLASYIKKVEVYDKTQTYSRTQIDNLILSMVDDAVSASISEYKDSINNKFEEIRKLKYIKQDGSIPFRNPQSGVDAVEDNELTTLRQVTALIETLEDNLSTSINNKDCEWKTSGPVIGSAGLVESGTLFANTLTLQEIMDAIFYGKKVTITVPNLGSIGEGVNVEVCIQGSLAQLEHAELYQNGKLIATFTKEDFEEQPCIIIKSEDITEDTEFVFKVFYVNGSTHDVSAWTKVALPVFIGLLPKWKFGNTVSYDYLLELHKEDSINNLFYDLGENLATVSHTYSFTDTDWKHFILAVPANYPDLSLMSTPSQLFEPEAFDIIDMIPFQLPNTETDTIYKLYIYKLALLRANLPVTFNFE